jgi:hypothetical protein
MDRTGGKKGGELRQGDEGKKIHNLPDYERKIILCRTEGGREQKQKTTVLSPCILSTKH